MYAYREYGPTGGRTASQHAAALLWGEPGLPICAGGAKSEQQWRDEFCASGLPVGEPDVSDVEPGINRVYGAIATGKLIVFATLAGSTFGRSWRATPRELDDMGEPTEKIADKETFHLLDAVRYIVPSVVADGVAHDETPTILRP